MHHLQHVLVEGQKLQGLRKELLHEMHRDMVQEPEGQEVPDVQAVAGIRRVPQNQFADVQAGPRVPLHRKGLPRESHSLREFCEAHQPVHVSPVALATKVFLHQNQIVRPLEGQPVHQTVLQFRDRVDARPEGVHRATALL